MAVIAARRFLGDASADFHRFASVARGRYSLTYNRGIAALLPSGSEPSLKGSGQTWFVAFDGTVLDPLTRQAIDLVGSGDERFAAEVPLCERRHWEERLHYLETVNDEAATNEYEATRALLKSLVLDCLRLTRVDFGGGASGFQTLTLVLMFIERNFRRKITLREVADTVNFSPAYLTDLVRRETGMPIYRWITHYRLAEAKRLLRTTDMPLSSIADEVGFGDSSYFSRRFTKSVGVTPATWRRSQRREDDLAPERTERAKPGFDEEASMRLAIDSIPHIVWVKDHDGSLLYANRRWYDYTGLTVEQSRGWGWLAAVHPDEVSRILAHWRAARVTGEDVKYNVRLRRAYDSVYREHAIHTIAYGASGGRWFGTATDVADWRRRPRSRYTPSAA
jgi:PAS domain S-box-containing protein